MKKFVLAIVGILVLLQCILSVLSSFRVESAPLENQPHYSVVNGSLFVFSSIGHLEMQLYNDTDETIFLEAPARHPYKVIDKNGHLVLTDFDDLGTIAMIIGPPEPVPAHGSIKMSNYFHFKELPMGKYKMQAAAFESGTLKEVFPSAEFEFYYIPIPYPFNMIFSY